VDNLLVDIRKNGQAIVATLAEQSSSVDASRSVSRADPVVPTGIEKGRPAQGGSDLCFSVLAEKTASNQR